MAWDVSCGSPSRAHHGWAGYLNEEFELTGALETPVSISNPHATMKLRVDDQVWDVVLAAPNRTTSAGLREGIIPVGAQVTVQVTAIATRDGSRSRPSA
jgi:Family of unknown function (DUF6152)